MNYANMKTNNSIDLELKSVCFEYEIIEPLGEGAFGVVYLAKRKDGLFDNVALKCIDMNKLIKS